MARLAIFDIDGTLTDTNTVDDDVYREVVSATIGVAPELIDWSGALHITDAGIFQWLCAAHGRAEPTPSEIASARSAFVDRLEAALKTDPTQFSSVAGAANAIRHASQQGWFVAIATGGWGASARLKLRAAHIHVADDVIASADDAVDRAGIVQLARSRAESFYEQTFDRVVAIGDGAWDVAAAATLRLPFVGIASGDKAETLRRAGAGVVLRDYADLDAFTRALASAQVPAPSIA